jgi:hypothetical protein
MSVILFILQKSPEFGIYCTLCLCSSSFTLDAAVFPAIYRTCRTESVAGMPAKKAVVTDAAGGKVEVVHPNVHISKVSCRLSLSFLTEQITNNSRKGYADSTCCFSFFLMCCKHTAELQSHEQSILPHMLHASCIPPP